MRTRVAAMAAVLGAAACLTGQSEGPSGAEYAEFPHAGIALAMPKGFEHQTVDDPFDVLRAVRFENRLPIMAVSLSAFSIADNADGEAVAEKMLAQAREALAMRDLSVIKKTPMPVAGLAGSARLLRYVCRGVPTTAASVFFVRENKEPKVRVCYVLTVEAVTEKEPRLLPVLGEVINTVKLIAFEHPAAIRLKETPPPMEDYKRGYSIRPPRGWHATQTAVGIQMAQADYLLGGTITVTATVMVSQPPPAAQPRSEAGRTMDLAIRRNPGTKVLSQGPSQLAGREAWQFVLTQPPREPVKGAAGVTIVQRVACRPAEGGAAKRTYSLILVCQDGSADAAGAIMDQLAGGFAFLTPPPASAPATPTPASGPGPPK